MPVVIGDVHGQFEALERLLERLAVDPAELIFLGDYVDRGPDSRQVLELVRRLREDGAVTLMGNHEEMMLRSIRGQADALDVWLRNGGMNALSSFAGVEPGTAGTRRTIHFLLAQIPDWVEAWLDSLPLYHEWEEYVLVHAGVRPGRPLYQQRRSDLLWIREEFLRHNDPLPGRTVVFGHTVTYFLTHRLTPLRLPGKIGIDTGAGYGGCLTALRLPEETFEQVPVNHEDPTRQRSALHE